MLHFTLWATLLEATWTKFLFGPMTQISAETLQLYWENVFSECSEGLRLFIDTSCQITSFVSQHCQAIQLDMSRRMSALNAYWALKIFDSEQTVTWFRVSGAVGAECGMWGFWLWVRPHGCHRLPGGWCSAWHALYRVKWLNSNKRGGSGSMEMSHSHVQRQRARFMLLRCHSCEAVCSHLTDSPVGLAKFQFLASFSCK